MTHRLWKSKLTTSKESKRHSKILKSNNFCKNTFKFLDSGLFLFDMFIFWSVYFKSFLIKWETIIKKLYQNKLILIWACWVKPLSEVDVSGALKLSFKDSKESKRFSPAMLEDTWKILPIIKYVPDKQDMHKSLESTMIRRLSTITVFYFVI